MKKLIPLTIFTVLILTACCKPAPPNLYLKIEDANGVNLAVGAIPSDTSWAVTNNTANPIGDPIDLDNIEGEDVFDLNAWGISSGEDFYIIVEPGDIDTVNEVFEIKGRCHLKPKVESISYNGNSFEGGKKDAVITVVKY